MAFPKSCYFVTRLRLSESKEKSDFTYEDAEKAEKTCFFAIISLSLLP